MLPVAFLHDKRYNSLPSARPALDRIPGCTRFCDKCCDTSLSNLYPRSKVFLHLLQNDSSRSSRKCEDNLIHDPKWPQLFWGRHPTLRLAPCKHGSYGCERNSLVYVRDGAVLSVSR